MATLYSTALSVLAPVVDNGVLPGDPRVAVRLDEAQRRLINQYNFVSAREESLEPALTWQPGGTAPGLQNSQLILDDLDSTKLMILCAFREENNQLEMAEALEKKAFGYVERDIVDNVSRQRYAIFSDLALTDQNTFGGIVGRIGLETFESYKAPKPRLQSFVNQAYQQAIDHYNFIVRNEQTELPPLSYSPLVNDTDCLPQAITAEVIRGFTLAMFAQNAVADIQYTANKDLQTFKAEAQQLLERNVLAAIQRLRFENRKHLSDTAEPSTFGYHWGRVGLELPNNLSYSDDQIKRAVNTAEELLMNAGKWVGTIDTYTLTSITASGEIFLPREVETVLFAQFGSNPQPVFDRFNEWMADGSGLRTADHPWRYAFVDRGEGIDPNDGMLKRKYFISYPDAGAQEVTILAKKRPIPHVSNTEPMILRNYRAILEAVQYLLTEGKTGSLETAKQLLAAQVNQNFFKQNMNSVHNKRVVSFR